MKIKLFDVIILFICIAIVSLVVLKFYRKSAVADTKNISFTVEALSVETDCPLKAGDEIRDNQRGYYYGVVSEITSAQAIKVVEDVSSGVYVKSQVPDRMDLHVTISCKGNETDKDITVEGNPIRLGKLLSLKTKGCVINGYVLDIRTE